MDKANVKTATLKAREERRLIRGHLWAYRNEFEQLPDLEDGELVDVYASNRRFVGRGFFQAEGGIAVRLLSRHQESIDKTFLADRITQARAFRERLFPGETVYRWIFGESDGLPGWVADRYGPVVSAQTSCTFYRTRLDGLADSFLAQPDIEGIVIQAANEMRRYGRSPETLEVDLDGLRVNIDISTAQKTGLFLDQRANYRKIRSFAAGARVLDGHCYVGLGSCHAALAGAVSVLGVDTSTSALEQARTNTALNGVSERCRFECAEVEEILERDARYDLVILDPPALVKARAQLRKGLMRYEALNAAALKVVEPGGVLITSSCSHFVDAPAFLEVLKRAAANAQRRVWLIELRGAGPDHPVLLSMPETGYLKCAILRVF